MKRSPLVLFLLANFFLLGFVFRDAVWGGSLLAPIDLAPALLSKYRYVDPSVSIPENHYAIDQLIQDLPLQRTIYEAFHRGEIPWWDPYTYAGRPLLADGHVNGTDFVRLLMYGLLPFELAYNWTLILHFFLGGLGMFLLLRHLGLRGWVCILFSLTYEFAGCQTLYFQHPWIQGSFLYYPFLWLAWEQAARRPSPSLVLGGAVLVAGIFYSGSVQTHAYLPVFAAAFGLGGVTADPKAWKRLLFPVGLSIVLGALLAAPMLGAEVELYQLSSRPPAGLRASGEFLCGIGSLSAFFPWCLGTFRTFDAGKLLGQPALGFHLYIGSAALVLAVFGAALTTSNARWAVAKRIALVLAAVYFLILSTPLQRVFYARIAFLPVMGLVILAALGVELLLERQGGFRRTGRLILVVLGLGLGALQAFAWVVYPRILPRLAQMVREREKDGTMLNAGSDLRDFQLSRLPREISLENPETILAAVSLLGLAVLLLNPEWRKNRVVFGLLLGVNLLPELLFCQRYVPRHDISLWSRLEAGGVEQKRVAARLADTPDRLWEVSPERFDFVFPGTLAHLFRVRVVQGYTSLPPKTAAFLPLERQERFSPRMGDWVYTSTNEGSAGGRLAANRTPGLARFQWLDRNPRRFAARDEGLNTIRLEFEPGPAAQMIWADTRFPGWQARADGRLLPLEPFEEVFTSIQVPADVKTLVLHYRPSHLNQELGLAGFGLLVMGLVAILDVRHQRLRGALS